MNRISRLEEKIGEIEHSLSGREGELHVESPDFAQSLAASSMAAHLENLQEELRVEKQKREKEIVELRFVGRPVEAGTMPLGVAGDLLSYLSDSLHATSYFVQKGKNLSGRVPADIVERLNLRMAGLSAGSARIFVAGALSPDMFGNSLLEMSLENTFDVLEASGDNEVVEAVSNVGKRSANKIKGFLEDLGKSKLEMEMNWDTPRDRVRRWNGSRSKIRTLESSLDQIQVESEQIQIEGQLVMMSKRGRVEIEAEDGSSYSCSFPKSLLEIVRPHHIGDIVFAKITAETYTNEATRARRTSYKLRTLRDPEAFRRAGLME